MSCGCGKRRRNPVPENHGQDVDDDTQARIARGFQELPVRTYGKRRAGESDDARTNPTPVRLTAVQRAALVRIVALYDRMVADELARWGVADVTARTGVSQLDIGATRATAHALVKLGMVTASYTRTTSESPRRGAYGRRIGGTTKRLSSEMFVVPTAAGRAAAGGGVRANPVQKALPRYRYEAETSSYEWGKATLLRIDMDNPRKRLRAGMGERSGYALHAEKGDLIFSIGAEFNRYDGQWFLGGERERVKFAQDLGGSLAVPTSSMKEMSLKEFHVLEAMFERLVRLIDNDGMGVRATWFETAPDARPRRNPTITDAAPDARRGIPSPALRGASVQTILQRPAGYDPAHLTQVLRPADVARLVAHIGALDQEVSLVLALDQRKRVIAVHEAGKGGADSVPLSRRTLVKVPLLAGARGVITVHNHPSGDAMPSKADVRIAQARAKSLECAGLELLDSLVIGAGRYESMRMQGLLPGAKLSGGKYKWSK